MSTPFKVELVLKVGESADAQVPIVVEVHPEWAPRGAARFRELVESGYYDGCKFHRVVDNFMAQIGICGDPKLYASWAGKKIDDDTVTQSNKRGTLSFATSGPNARSTQVFFNLVDNTFLDDSGFSPFAVVVDDGMERGIDQVYSGYGEGAPKGRGPEQARVKEEGDAYLAGFPKLSSIASAKVIQG
eukprot:CAMPEP_0119416946 /NCGR_PEP_ID=MMETSP1335-20130426/14495_1 /TAXON_ID=259385 /ORGANISM="Chrysoculter rhomboideus, Strain RCC1486" /LENGTH=186 /DNA_ID=CAMNT_0007442093 /DNA_START=32 /DNA_END=592 /DNA_ORIENTATION=-